MDGRVLLKDQINDIRRMAPPPSCTDPKCNAFECNCWYQKKDDND